MERTSNINNTSVNVVADDDRITSIITCPITFEKIKDAVIDPDGHTYERTAILTWLQNNHTSPITRTPLHKEQLVPNHALSRFLDIWRQQQQDEDNGCNENDCEEEEEDGALMNRVLGNTSSRKSILSCPITGKIMSEPVIDPDGNTFEKSAISKWLSFNGASPITASAQNPNQLIPNRALALLLLQYYEINQKQKNSMSQSELPGTTSENIQDIFKAEDNRNCCESSQTHASGGTGSAGEKQSGADGKPTRRVQRSRKKSIELPGGWGKIRF